MERLSWLVCAAAVLAVAGCDDGGNNSCASQADCEADEICLDGTCVPGGTDGDADTDADGDTDGDSDADGDAVDCPADREECEGVCCAEEERCLGGICCAEASQCGPACCSDDEVCMGGHCHLACEGGSRCLTAAGEEICCSSGEVCFMGACIVPGDPCASDVDCGLDEYCEEAIGECLPIPDSECLYVPPTGEFLPVIEWEWPPPEGTTIRTNALDVLAPPAVGDMDGDGVPEVAFITYRDSCAGGLSTGYRLTGNLTIVRGDTGEEVLRLNDSDNRLNANTAPALGDVDGDGLPEIVVHGANYRLYAYELDGTLVWRSDDDTQGVLDGAISIADLDSDGTPEIFMGACVFNSAGAYQWHGTGGTGGRRDNNGISTAADLDGDGDLEIIAGNTAHHHDGTVYWQNDSIANGFPGVADFFDIVGASGLDGVPEVARISSGQVYIVNGQTGEILWGPHDIPGSGHSGAPTIADFDGDGLPEIGTAAGNDMIVYDPDGAEPILWQEPTKDTSSAVTGSTVFDFEGDGIAEIVYTDECFVHIYSGPDGAILFKAPNNTRTQYEFPLLVDVDADGNSELVVTSNACVWDCESYSDWSGPARRGIQIYGDELRNWVRTRRIWNQHSYHVTNVNSDGTIPSPEPRNWLDDGLNNFRQNVQTWGVHNAPDLTPEIFGADMRECSIGNVTLGVTVMNRGSRGVEAGVNVAFYQVLDGGTRTLLGVANTMGALLPGMSEYVELDWEIPPEQLDAESFTFVVVVDDVTIGEVAFHECREDNNESEPITVECELIG